MHIQFSAICRVHRLADVKGTRHISGSELSIIACHTRDARSQALESSSIITYMIAASSQISKLARRERKDIHVEGNQGMVAFECSCKSLATFHMYLSTWQSMTH